MKICLKTQAKQLPLMTTCQLIDRLPSSVQGPCTLQCHLSVENRGTYFLLNLSVQGELMIQCQRCLQAFPYTYQNDTSIAVCDNDDLAESLLSQFESLVATNLIIDLEAILTDDLYLFLPEKHEKIADCNPEIVHFMGF